MSEKKSTLLPLIQKKIAVQKRYLLNDKITSWIMHMTGEQGHIEDFYGNKIPFAGLKFEGSPSARFWGRFIEPFLESFTDDMIEIIRDECEKNKLNIRTELEELAQNLRGMYTSVYDKMSDIDQRIRGEGYPDNVDRVKTESYVTRMNLYLDQHIAMVLGKFKSKNSIKQKFIASLKEKTLAWITGAVFTVLSMLWAVLSSGF